MYPHLNKYFAIIEPIGLTQHFYYRLSTFVSSLKYWPSVIFNWLSQTRILRKYAIQISLKADLNSQFCSF
jgi:hypothetical protein